MTDYNWIFKKEVDINKVEHLSDVLKVGKNIATLLIQRGIENYEAAKQFFRPQLSELHSPFLMKNMDIAVNRLLKAVDNKENILIFGDYDVDGTTGTALLYKFLKQFNNNISYYIPDRYTEGYGVSIKGINYAIENNIDLIITVDCGIKCIKPIEKANLSDIDVIVCDHHEKGSIIPPAFAVLDAKQNDCNYPYKELSGCGVAFKLLQAFCINKNLDQNKYLFNFLDLVVVSIASDIVPITGENRILAYYGLKIINTIPSIGLKTMKKQTELSDKEIQINDIVFKIAPRINAAGRIDTGLKAVELLICEDENLAEEICMEIENFNNSRKNLDQKITDEALNLINSDENLIKAAATVVYSEGWSKGVIGIVASRLIETYYRPTVVFTKSGDKLTGSARSVAGFNLYNAIESCDDLLENYGGHFYAAGITLKEENFENFKIRFENYVKNNISYQQTKPSINIDLKIDFNDITPKFSRLLKQFAPFGPQNMTPVFVSDNVSDNSFGKVIGKNYEHLKLQLIQNKNYSIIFDAVGFGLGELFDKLNNSQTFSVCYNINENMFLNQISLQIAIKDIRFETL